MRLLVSAIAQAGIGPLVDDDKADDTGASMSRGQVMAAARALCPQVGQQPDALRDLVSTLRWPGDSLPGRVIVYEALRNTGGELGLDADLIELRESLYEEPSRHQSWRIRRYATLGALVAAALQSVHVGEELDEVHELLQSSQLAGAWPR